MTIEEFQKSDLRIGKIVSAELVESSGKLLKFLVDIGEATPRRILSGVAKVYAPGAITGKNVIVVANLDSRIMAGTESQGMLLGIEHLKDGTPMLFFPEGDIAPGTKIS